MKNQWRIILGFILVLLVVLFAIFNNNAVDVSFIFGQFKAPLVIIILGSAIIGALVTILTSTTSMWNQRKTIKKQQIELEELEKNFDKKVKAEKNAVEERYENKISALHEEYRQRMDELGEPFIEPESTVFYEGEDETNSENHR